jgi:hypothetical protein
MVKMAMVIMTKDKNGQVINWPTLKITNGKNDHGKNGER